MAGRATSGDQASGKANLPATPERSGDSLAAATQAILGDAQAVLTDSRLSDAEAVHEIRKAFKRWRAMLRLLAGPIGEPAEDMRKGARDLMRLLSGSRDIQAALDAMADLDKSDLPLSATSMKTIEGRLVKLRNETGAKTLTPELRQRVAQYLHNAATSTEHWPLATIEFDTIAGEMAVTYRRARQLIPDKWHEAEPEDLHDLRKRVVEHRHQIELLEPLWPRLGKVWGHEAQRLRERLGSCQDLSVIESFMAPHGALAPWRSKLALLIADRRASHLNAAEKLANRLFAEKPKAFRTRITALWNARKSEHGHDIAG